MAIEGISEQLDARYRCPELWNTISSPIMPKVMSGNHIFGVKRPNTMGAVSAPSDMAQFSQSENIAFSFDI